MKYIMSWGLYSSLILQKNPYDITVKFSYLISQTWVDVISV